MAKRIQRRTVLAGGLAVAASGVGAFAVENESKPVPPNRAAQAPSSPVAVDRCDSYEPNRLREVFDRCFDRIGGIKKLVENKTVTVKLNLTGMVWSPACGLPARETYQTQPNTVAALCAIFAEAGAKAIVLIENLYWERPMEQTLVDSGWDIAAIQAAGHHRVTFEDTRNKGKFPGYSRFKVPWGGYIFPAFDMNQRFEKTDVLVSLAKLKQHAMAGVTGAVKNFFGNTPSSIYGDDGPGEGALKHRAAMFHGGGKKPPPNAPQELDHGLPRKGTIRVPRIVADIYGARPADLCVVDGVRTITRGEGPWIRAITLVEPKLMIVGRNGVCTDAVCTQLMGFDPTAEHGVWPFQGDNHLRLLADAGIGTNDPTRIEVRGVSVKEAVFPFPAKVT